MKVLQRSVFGLDERLRQTGVSLKLTQQRLGLLSDRGEFLIRSCESLGNFERTSTSLFFGPDHSERISIGDIITAISAKNPAMNPTRSPMSSPKRC